MEKNKKTQKNKRTLTDKEISDIIAEKGDEITLQEIGNLYGVTRMRICQIEKLSLQKLAEIASLRDEI